MSEPDDSRRKRLARITKLLDAASAGILDSLECPDCGQRSVSVWFTHPAEGEYRTWFVCRHCECHMHAINIGIPPHYSEDRISERLENFDERVLSSMRFK